jgi:hypothetical protein
MHATDAKRASKSRTALAAGRNFDSESDSTAVTALTDRLLVFMKHILVLLCYKRRAPQNGQWQS